MKIITLLILSSFSINAQTTIINPVTVGGFESGSTFALNGWTATTGAVNPLNHWICNTGATVGFSGTNCAYITETGTNHSYGVNTTHVSHLYRDITIPVGEININLDFKWIGNGEATYDMMKIWLVPTTFTPVYNTAITTAGVAPTGNIQVGLAEYSAQTTWANAATITIPAAYAGTTVRLIFQWQNDNSVGTNPPAAIDNVSLISSAPCLGTPTAITATAITGSTATINWTAAAPAPTSGYQYYLSTANTAPTAGTMATGSVGAGIVTTLLTGLTPGTNYYIWIRTNCGSGQGAWSAITNFLTLCTSSGIGVSSAGCPNIIAGGLGLSGADPAPISCATASCVDIEANYLNLGTTTTYTVSSIPYSPPYQFNCLANPVSVGIDDTWSPVVNLPFNFCFYGNNYNSCVIGSNGIVSFDTTYANTASGYLFSSDLPSTAFYPTQAIFRNAIYGVYHDIDPSKGGEVAYELITLNTGCRALVVSYYNVPMFSNNSILYTGMMVLYENTNLIEVYIKEKKLDPGWNGQNAIVGVQNVDGTAAVVAPGRNGLSADWVSTNEAWRFTPAGPSITSVKWFLGSTATGPVLATTDVLNVCPVSTTTYTAEVTYTLCNATTITVTDQTTVNVGDKTWNGSVDTDWNKPNNWTPVGVPTAVDCIYIPNVTNDPIITGLIPDGLGYTLTIYNGGFLTLDSGKSLTIGSVINVNAGGIFNIKNTGNLVQINNVTNIGNINMERIANLRLQDYCYWASPVGNLLAGTFPVQSVSPLTPSYYIFNWGATTTNANGGQGDWVSTSENMIPAKGYILRAPTGFTNASASALTTNFIGVPSNGIFSPTIFRGTDFTTLGTQLIPRTVTDDNWNLLGNPYPSSIGVNEFLTLPANNSIQGFVKIWTHGQLPTNSADPFYEDFGLSYYPSDYITVNLTAATSGPGDYKIGAGQGFMVVMNPGAAGSSTVTFNNTMRSAAFGNSQFYRNEAKTANEQHRIWLDLVSPTGAIDRTALGYVTGATQEEDRLYDAFTDYKPAQNFYSLINDKPMIIQGRSLPFNINDKVSLGIKTATEGTYKIGIATVDGLFTNGSQIIYLEDKLQNVIHNLTISPYQFTAEKGIINDRFVLRYTEKSLSDNNDDNEITIFTSNDIRITSTEKTIKDVIIYDVLGKTLLERKNIGKLGITLNELKQTANVLIVKVILENNKVVIKKVIY